MGESRSSSGPTSSADPTRPWHIFVVGANGKFQMVAEVEPGEDTTWILEHGQPHTAYYTIAATVTP